MSESVFTREGDLYTPTPLAGSPWDPTGAQHGGAPAALLAAAIEAIPADIPMEVVRFSIKLLKPVPMRPLRAAARIASPGRRVQVVECSLFDGEREVVRGDALRVRRAEVPLRSQDDGQAPSSPEEGTDPQMGQRFGVGFWDAMDMRVSAGSVTAAGPATVWFRLRVPLIEGEANSPLMRVAAAADFGNGMSALGSFADFLFINPDLAVYLHRPPAGEWICLQAVTHAAGRGLGYAESALYDREGRVGRALQSLLMDERRPEMRGG
jgi:hypothetical protein